MKLSFNIILETYKALEGKGEQGASPYCTFPISFPKDRSVLGSLPTFTNSTGVREQTQRQPQGLQVSWLSDAHLAFILPGCLGDTRQ